MKSTYIIVLTTMVTLFSSTDSSKILAVMGVNGINNLKVFEPLLKALALRGHKMYVLDFIPQRNSTPNYIDISLDGVLPSMNNSLTIDMAGSSGSLFDLVAIATNVTTYCEICMKNPSMHKLLNSSLTFDLIITQILGPDCFLSLSYHFKAPIISLVTSVSVPSANDRVGNPDHPAYIPNILLPFTHNMNFIQRLKNTIFYAITRLINYYYFDIRVDKLNKKYFGEDIPSLDELKKNTSVVFVNSHFSLHTPRPTVPAFVEVGGLHIQNNGELPQDLQLFLDGATEGVIYFSLGSMFRCSSFPKETLKVFVDAFSQIPQKVLWKIENVTGLPALPKNVITSEWFPQIEILSHPNVRLFITHGGLLGLQEAVYTGVPMLGLPLFADQYHNIQFCVSRNIAISLDWKTISTEMLLSAMRELWNNMKYSTNVKKLSEIFRDRPQTPLETAVYWTEYVIRYRGAKHLRSAAVDLPWYQYLLLDVIAVFILVISVISVSTYYCLKMLFCMISGYFKKTRKEVARKKIN